VYAEQGAIGIYGESAPDGAFVFPGLPEGEWRLRAYDGEWTGEAVATAGDEAEVTIELRPSAGGR
jgi:hypothetical protein